MHYIGIHYDKKKTVLPFKQKKNEKNTHAGHLKLLCIYILGLKFSCHKLSQITFMLQLVLLICCELVLSPF